MSAPSGVRRSSPSASAPIWRNDRSAPATAFAGGGSSVPADQSLVILFVEKHDTKKKSLKDFYSTLTFTCNVQLKIASELTDIPI